MTRQTHQVPLSHAGNSNKTIHYAELGYTGQVYSRFEGHGFGGRFVRGAKFLKKRPVPQLYTWFKYLLRPSHLLGSPSPHRESSSLSGSHAFSVTFLIASLNRRITLQLSNSYCLNAFIGRAVSREGLWQRVSVISHHRHIHATPPPARTNQAYLKKLTTYVEIRRST